MDKHFLDINQFQQLEKIGKGQFGVVYKVRDIISGLILAAKISKDVVELTDDNKSLIRNLVREVNIIAKLNHPSIVQFIGFSRFDFHGKAKPVIITELMKGGSLSDLINLERRGCSNEKWDDTRKLITLYGIASAMMYLHSHNIIHRDLKPDNILMDDEIYPKIADFGLSKILHKNEDSLSAASTGGFKGTFLYSSPEVITDNEYTKAGDVYSFAIIAFELMTNEEPFKNCSFMELINKVPNGIRPTTHYKMPDAYKELIENCWSQNQEDRPTFEQIVDDLKNDKNFITDLVDEKDFINYIDYIDDCKVSFDTGKPFISINEFVRKKSIRDKKSKSKLVVNASTSEEKEPKPKSKLVINASPSKEKEPKPISIGTRALKDDDDDDGTIVIDVSESSDSGYF